MKTKTIRSFSLFLALIMLFSTVLVADFGAYAKAGKATTSAVYLSHKKTYSSYDITGNGKADKIKVNYLSAVKTSDGVGHASVYVNGKKKRVFKGGNSVKVRLIAPTKKKVFLVVEYNYKDGIYEAFLYRYSSGKFKKIYSNSIYYPFSSGKITKVSSDTISVKATTTKYDNGLFPSDYSCAASFKIYYSINKYKISRKSRYLTAYDNYFYAKKDFWTSSGYDYNDESGIYFETNDLVKIRRCHINGNYDVSFELENWDGNTGWIFSSDFDWEDPYLCS